MESWETKEIWRLMNNNSDLSYHLKKVDNLNSLIVLIVITKQWALIDHNHTIDLKKVDSMSLFNRLKEEKKAA